MKSVQIIIPVYNEEEALPALAAALRPLLDNRLTPCAYSWSVLLVDDGSTDRSALVETELRRADPRFHILALSRNFGKEAALLAGLDHADADAVIVMDADLQHPVEIIPRLLERWEEGFDDVYGRMSTRARLSAPRRLATSLYYSLLRRVNCDVGSEVSDFRLLSRRCVLALRSLRESQRYTRGLFNWVGFPKAAVDFVQAPRRNGNSSFNFRKLFNLAMDGMTGFSIRPLRFATVLGFVTALIALSYLIYVFVKTLLFGDPVAGYPTIMCVMLLLGGAQLITLGIIGEYVGKIYLETKRRPPYIVKSFSENDEISERNIRN